MIVLGSMMPLGIQWFRLFWMHTAIMPNLLLPTLSSTLSIFHPFDIWRTIWKSWTRTTLFTTSISGGKSTTRSVTRFSTPAFTIGRIAASVRYFTIPVLDPIFKFTVTWNPGGEINLTVKKCTTKESMHPRKFKMIRFVLALIFRSSFNTKKTGY